MDFDLASDNYQQFIKYLRNRVKDPNRSSHGKPALPPPPPNGAHGEYIDIELRAASSRTVTTKIRRHDLYLIGYRMHEGRQWLEFSQPDGRRLIRNSQFLGFRANYEALGGLDSNFHVGYDPLSNAINDLATTTDGESRKSALRVLAVMICKSARFDKLLDIFAEQVRKRTETSFQRWMKFLIHSWGDLSLSLLREDSQRGRFSLPKDCELTTVVGIRVATDASHCLGVLHGKYAATAGKRQPLVEVFSVRVDNIDDEVDLYGNITVTDGLGSFYLYNRAKDNSESILPPNDIASLIGPNRSISLCQIFTISLNLIERDEDNNLSDLDDEISKRSFSWDMFYLSVSDYNYEKRLCQTVDGEYGSASVFYTMFHDAVQAKVDVVITDVGQGKDPARVYGSPVALDNNYDYSLHEQKKYYQTRLLNIPYENTINIKQPWGRIPLSRHMVAVPTASSLIIEANLWDHGTIANVEIAKGVATFPPKTDGKSSVHDIIGKYGSVRITVTWSAITGG